MTPLFKSFVKNPSDTGYDGKDNDEVILYVLRKAFVTNYTWMLFAFVFLAFPNLFNMVLSLLKVDFPALMPTKLVFVLNAFWYLFCFGFIFANFCIWFFNVYIITNKKIVDMDFEGLLYKNISEAPLTNIEDVTSNISGAFGTIFNVGDVLIQTAAEKTEFDFEEISDPSKVRDIISDLVTGVKHNDGK